jgi:hypothetical protein
MEKNETDQARIFRMISPQGFTNLFWEEIKTAQSSGKHLTHEEAFDKLNEEYHQTTGKYRYKSFSSFKTLRDK